MGGLHLLLESKVDEGELLNSLTLSTILDAPHRHNRLFHPLGCLAAYLSSLKHESGACMMSVLQWGHRLLGWGGFSSPVQVF